VQDKQHIKQIRFSGFRRCLFPVQKFDSDSERRLAVILDRDAQKWFRPARDQFSIYYQHEGDERQYQPDFVVESDRFIDMIECKARDELESVEVRAKATSALKWCQHASDHATQHGGKPWRYLLIPHDEVSENKSLEGLAATYRRYR
jgi:type III restriction enzyme